jgi:hypothetical protein
MASRVTGISRDAIREADVVTVTAVAVRPDGTVTTASRIVKNRYGPLEPKAKTPRKWDRIQEVPISLTVTDVSGDVCKYVNGGWGWRAPWDKDMNIRQFNGTLDSVNRNYGPFTEIIPEDKPVDTTPHGEGGPGSDSYFSFLD